jgi:steroid delta-isomerase-like uncharacterized protein
MLHSPATILMTRDEILQLFERRREDWSRHDAAALAADHGEACKVESPAAGILSGRNAIEGVYRGWFAAFPDLELVTDEVLIDGDRAALAATVTGTHVGEFLGLPPSGRRFKFRAMFMFVLRDGLIVHERRIYDFTGLLVQIGVLKTRPA